MFPQIQYKNYLTKKTINFRGATENSFLGSFRTGFKTV